MTGGRWGHCSAQRGGKVYLACNRFNAFREFGTLGDREIDPFCSQIGRKVTCQGSCGHLGQVR
eukprot:1248017-Ditylum_brightwellii.AAC.2